MSGAVPDAAANSAYKSDVISSLLDALIRALTRLVFGMRAAVLDRPFLRALLRVLGRPAIWLVHLAVGRSGLPPETPPPQSEPVLRLPLAYRPAPAPAFRIAVVLHAYYLDVLPEISRRLRHLPRADLYVSTDTPEKKSGDRGAVRRLGPGFRRGPSDRQSRAQRRPPVRRFSRRLRPLRPSPADPRQEVAA
jgi:hypothetical protein